jgi:DNA-binding transcriptional LysR family regulator
MDSGDIDLLLSVAQTGSLSGAARRLGVAVSTIGRRLDALEATLGLRLVDRRMNGARLTPGGERIAALAEPVAEGLARIGRAAAAMRQGGGRESVVVSATEFIVSDVLAPALPRLYDQHPGITVTLRSEAALVSLAAREADVAVRMSRPEGNSLLAKKLPEQRLGLFASAAYVSERDPARLELRLEKLLVYDDSYGRLPELDWLGAAGLEASVALRTGSTRALVAATAAGAGIGLLPDWAGRLAGLVEIPPPADIPGRSPWLIVHRDLRRLPSIRAVHAWIVRAFTK